MAEIFTSDSSAKSSNKEGNYGKFCIFLTRGCGAVSAVVLLVLGFVTLLPVGIITGFSFRCVGVGFIFIITSVAMFFLEVTVLGHCVDQLKFLLVISKYLKHWHRAVFYMGFSVAPIVLYCISFSTIFGMIILFLVGVLNLAVALGKKGDHTERLAARWQRVAGDEELERLNGEEEEEEEEESGEDSKASQKEESNL